MRFRILILLTALVLASLGNIAEADSAPAFQGLGDLPGGPFDSSAFGVSADGSVVVGNGTVAGGHQAFRWTASTGMVALAPDSPLENFAYGTSADGSVVVGSQRLHAFRWSASGLTVFDSTSNAVAVSADGSVVVGQLREGKTARAVRWTNAGELSELGGDGLSGATDVTADGSVLAGFHSPGGAPNLEAFRWTARSGVLGLGYLPGTTRPYSLAYALSDDGSVVVGRAFDGPLLQAFRWTAQTGMQSISPGLFASANDVSGDGSIVVGDKMQDQFRYDYAFLWDQPHGFRSLKEVLVADFGLGQRLQGWTLVNAFGISTDGTTIVGTGTNPAGQAEAWRAVLPEPAAAAWTLLVLSVALTRAGRTHKASDRGAWAPSRPMEPQSRPSPRPVRQSATVCRVNQFAINLARL
jgi:uncharacterized membrane protein